MKKIVGVMGPGAGASKEDLEVAETLGALIAKQGWVLLTGGRNSGVMQAVMRGAHDGGGYTIGILPDHDKSQCAESVDFPIVTGMGSARNNINVLSSDVIIACGMGAGTASEIALAIKAGGHKKIILLNGSENSNRFFQELGQNQVVIVDNPQAAVELIKSI